MKKILILISIFLSVFIIISANNENKNAEMIKAQTDYIDYATITIDGSSITLPYTITLPAPNGTILNVGGPCNENMTNWTVQNGYLKITYTEPYDIMCLQDPHIYFIETPTLYNGIEYRYRYTIIAQ